MTIYELDLDDSKLEIKSQRIYNAAAAYYYELTTISLKNNNRTCNYLYSFMQHESTKHKILNIFAPKFHWNGWGR